MPNFRHGFSKRILAFAILICGSLISSLCTAQATATPPPSSPQLRKLANAYELKSEQLRIQGRNLTRQLRADLIAGKYDRLDKRLSNLENKVDHDAHYELLYDQTIDSISACSSADGSLERYLIKMEDARPHSAWTHILFGRYYEGMACHARGQGWASSVGQDKWQAVDNFDRRAVAEYLQAKAINPNLLMEYRGLMLIINQVGTLNEATAVYRQGESQFPHSYVLPYYYMRVLEPRWHGSYQLMKQFAVALRKNVAQNPRFYAFAGFIFADKANMAYNHKDYAASYALYAKALQYGEYPDWLEWAGESAEALRMYGLTYAYYTRYLVYKPDDQSARARRKIFSASCQGSYAADCRGYENAIARGSDPAGGR